MTSRTDVDRVRDLLATADVGWLIRGLAPDDADVRLSQVLVEITDVEQECVRRLGGPQRLLDILSADAQRFRPLIQTFAVPMTATMRTMVYLIIGGAHIAELNFEYRARQSSQLRVKLVTDVGEQLFTSDEHWDAEVLHHLGLAKIGGRPLIDGYHAFRTA